MAKEKAKARISIIKDNEFLELCQAELDAQSAIKREQNRRDAERLAGKLAYKGRPLPDHIQKAIDEMDAKAQAEEAKKEAED